MPNYIGRYARIINDTVVICGEQIITWAETHANSYTRAEARRQRKTAVEIMSPTYQNRRMTVKAPMYTPARKLIFMELLVFFEDLELLPAGINEVPSKPPRKGKKTGPKPKVKPIM